MIENDLSVELDEKLALLKQNLLLKLGEITEQNSKLEKPSSVFKVRLEASLGDKLSQARGRADSLEDKLQETCLAFEVKVKNANCMKAELNRREAILVNAIRQIQDYIRAMFDFKKEADDMRGTMQIAATEQCKTLRQLATETALLNKNKTALLKSILVFQPAKVCLQKMVSDLGDYPNVRDCVHYYLVLERLQEDLMSDESEGATEGVVGGRDVSELERRAVLKESALLDLKFKLKTLKLQVTLLEEQLDAISLDRIQTSAARHDLHRWIRKLHSASADFRQPEEGDPLDGIRDFTIVALGVAERLRHF